MDKHLLWLYGCFFGGLLLYMLNKASDRAKGTDPNIGKWWQYFSVYWIPLVTRFAFDTAIFVGLFNGQLVTKGFDALGWTNWSWVVMMITQFAPVAFLFGLAVDGALDKFLTSYGDKIPLIGSVIPTIPLPHQAEAKP